MKQKILLFVLCGIMSAFNACQDENSDILDTQAEFLKTQQDHLNRSRMNNVEKDSISNRIQFVYKNEFYSCEYTFNEDSSSMIFLNKEIGNLYQSLMEKPEVAIYAKPNGVCELFDNEAALILAYPLKQKRTRIDFPGFLPPTGGAMTVEFFQHTNYRSVLPSEFYSIPQGINTEQFIPEMGDLFGRISSLQIRCYDTIGRFIFYEKMNYAGRSITIDTRDYRMHMVDEPDLGMWNFNDMISSFKAYGSFM